MQRDFDQLPLDFPELGGYFTVLGTLTYFLVDLVCSEVDTAKLFERSLWTFWAEISPHFTLRLRVAETALRAS